MIEESQRRRVVARCVPIGVVDLVPTADISLEMLVSDIAPALMMGNCVVMISMLNTASPTVRLGELCRDVLPRGVFNLVSEAMTAERWYLKHSGIDVVTLGAHQGTRDRRSCLAH